MSPPKWATSIPINFHTVLGSKPQEGREGDGQIPGGFREPRI